MTFIVYFRGLPGVGKSTIARSLAKNLSMPIIDYDDVKGALVNYLEVPELPIASYNIVKNILESNINSNNNIIFDSHGFYKEAFRKCSSVTNNIILINCTCSDEENWRLRLTSRTDIRPSHINDPDTILSLKHKMENIDSTHTLEIDTIHGVDQSVSSILQYLKENNFL